MHYTKVSTTAGHTVKVVVQAKHPVTNATQSNSDRIFNDDDDNNHHNDNNHNDMINTSNISLSLYIYIYIYI